MGQVIPISIDKNRAVEQAVNSFGGLPVVMWEYIINGLAYIDKGKTPVVEVKLEKNKIQVQDNGRGLNREDLNNFWKAYAENKDRKDGSYVYINRGYFGTGGLSIFKFANKLEIRSVKNKKLYVGTVNFKDLKKEKGGFHLEIDGEKTDAENGTIFVGTELNKEIGNKSTRDVKEYVKKQMMKCKGAEVYINDDLLRYAEPTIEENVTKIINSKNTEFFKDLNDLGFGAGEVILTLKKTKRPLPKGEYGVSVLGDGNLLEVCWPGIESKKYCNYIIGEAEIKNIYKNLERFRPPLFDQSRRSELSLDNNYVVKLRNFIGSELVKFEQEVSKIEKARDQEKFNKELSKKLNKISDKANEILKDVWEKLNLDSFNNQNLSKKSKRTSAKKDVINKIIAAGDELYKQRHNEVKDKKKKSDSKPPEDLKNKNNSKLKEEKTKKNNLGGLRIVPKQMGEDERRARFLEEDSVIYVNTDFPPLKKFIDKGDIESRELNALFKEIAGTELAVAMTSMLLQKGDYDGDVSTAMYDLLERINDFSRRFDQI